MQALSPPMCRPRRGSIAAGLRPARGWHRKSPHAPDGPSHGLMLPANAPAEGPDALDACAAGALLVVGTLSWTALTLAEFGAFSRPVFIVAAILVAAALAAWLRPIGGWI